MSERNQPPIIASSCSPAVEVSCTSTGLMSVSQRNAGFTLGTGMTFDTFKHFETFTLEQKH